MTNEEMDLDSCPPGEDVIFSVGDCGYSVGAKYECKLYKNFIINTIGEPPGTSYLLIKKNNHDFGYYYTLVYQYNADSEEHCDYAEKLDNGDKLLYWPKEYKDFLIDKKNRLEKDSLRESQNRTNKQ